jgi:hypothetical protein
MLIGIIGHEFQYSALSVNAGFVRNIGDPAQAEKTKTGNKKRVHKTPAAHNTKRIRYTCHQHEKKENDGDIQEFRVNSFLEKCTDEVDCKSSGRQPNKKHNGKNNI